MRHVLVQEAPISPRCGAFIKQLGIGVKNGAEIGGRMAQLVFDSEGNLVLLSLDNENGFNTLPRGLFCSGLAEFAPELLHWFQYA